MREHNAYNLKPGVYVDEQGLEVVVLDVVDHAWNGDKQMVEYLSSPLVVCRDLITKEDKRYVWPMDVFKSKFNMIKEYTKSYNKDGK